MQDDPVLFAHVNKEECRAFDSMLGETPRVPIDDQFIARMQALGIPLKDGYIRDYRSLKEVLEQPEVQETFEKVIAEADQTGGQSPELEHFYEIGKSLQEPFHEIKDEDPIVRQLSEEGQHGDTELCLLYESTCDFLDSLRGEPKTNTKTGFPEYWSPKNFINSTVRVFTTVAGAIVGGPAGAAAGNALGRMVTGQDPGKAIMASLPNALYAMGAQGLGSLAASSMPGSMIGNLGSQVASAGGAASTSNMMGSLGLNGGNAAGASGMGAGGSGGGGISSLLSLAKSAAPYALTAYGVNALHKGYNAENEAHERQRQEDEKRREELRRRMGMADKLAPLSSDSYNSSAHDLNNRQRESLGFSKGGSLNKLSNSSKEDYVDSSRFYSGSSKGQDDNLKVTAPSKAYIVNATAVSHLGDGNTNAGKKVLEEWERRIKKSYKGPVIKKKTHSQKIRTSSGEGQISPLTVTLVGYGDNQEGAKRLNSAIEHLMAEKASHGSKLPPKAKSFDYYLNR